MISVDKELSKMRSMRKSVSITLFLVVAFGLLSFGLTAQAQSVTIRYANWNVGTEEENNLQRQLVAAYEASNPGVTVEFVDMSGDGRWDEKLTNYAARGELPDVFMADNTPYYVQSGWAADLRHGGGRRRLAECAAGAARCRELLRFGARPAGGAVHHGLLRQPGPV
jgi:hypothetical protein